MRLSGGGRRASAARRARSPARWSRARRAGSARARCRGPRACAGSCGRRPPRRSRSRRAGRPCSRGRASAAPGCAAAPRPGCGRRSCSGPRAQCPHGDAIAAASAIRSGSGRKRVVSLSASADTCSISRCSFIRTSIAFSTFPPQSRTELQVPGRCRLSAEAARNGMTFVRWPPRRARFVRVVPFTRKTCGS